MKTKQRIISAVLAFVMCFSCMSSLIAFAAGEVGEEVQKTVATENEWESLKEKLATYNATWTNGEWPTAVTNTMVHTALQGNGHVGVHSDGNYSVFSQEKTYRISKDDFWDWRTTNHISVGGVTLSTPETSKISFSGCGEHSYKTVFSNVWDKSMSSEWVCTCSTEGKHHIIIDLGKSFELSKYVIQHSSGSMNRSFTVSVSTDGTNYETVETVTDNTLQATEFIFDAAKAVRYFRVDITGPNKNDTTVRIFEIELFDKQGRQLNSKDNTNIREELNIVDGVLTNDMDFDDVPVTINNWVSATEDVMITEIKNNGGIAVDLKSKLFTQSDYDYFPLAAGVNEDGSVWVSKTSSNPDEGKNHNSWTSKIVLMSKILGVESTAVKNSDGKSATLDFTIPAGETVYLVTSVGGGGKTYNWQGLPTGADPSKEAKEILAKVNSKEDINELKLLNDEWWKEYWLKSYIDIGDDIIQKFYYGSLYYLACASRADSVPVGLYGLWISTDNSKWSSDYHLNYNYEAPWYGIYSSNRAEISANLKDPLLDYMNEGKVNAKEELAKGSDSSTKQMLPAYINGGSVPSDYLGNGAYYFESNEFPGRPDLVNGIEDALLYPVGLGPFGMACDDEYYRQVTNAGYGAQIMSAYYDYTKDADYFTEVYPYMLGVANFWEAWLEKETFDDGSYRYNIWSGPHEGSFSLNSGPAIGVVKNNMKFLIDAMSDGLLVYTDEAITMDSCVKDGKCYVTKEKYDKWVDIYENIADMPISEGFVSVGERVSTDKNIVLLGEQGLLFSHAAPNVNVEFANASRLVRFDTDPYLRDAIKNSIEFKLENYPDLWLHRNEPCRIWAISILSGWDPADVMEHFRDIMTNYSYGNYTYYAGNHGIEMAAPIEFVNAMLLQADNGIIKAFPNWTGDDASFVRLCTEGAFLVSSSMKDGKVEGVELTSQAGGDVTIVNPWGNVKVYDSNGKSIAFTRGMTKNTNEETITFKTTKGATYTLVENAENTINSINVSRSSVILDVDDTVELNALVLPYNAINKSVVWSSSNEEVATVDQNGKVTAIGFGNATITARTVAGSLSDSCKISVGESISDISLSKTEMVKGTTFNMTTLGSEDWIVPIRGQVGQYYRKDVATPLIKQTGYAGSAAVEGGNFSLNWTDGSEAMSEMTAYQPGFFIKNVSGAGQYFEYTVPVESYAQTLTMLLGARFITGKVEVYLKSNPTDVKTISFAHTENIIASDIGNMMVSIDFVGTSGDELVVRYTMDTSVAASSSANNCQLRVLGLALSKHNLSAYKQGTDGTHYKVCTDEGCDYRVESACTGTVNCTEDTSCYYCGSFISKAPGHTEVVDEANEPTCTANGNTEGTHCAECNEVIVAPVILSAYGHTEIVDKAVDPTCTESGLSEGKHCLVCGDIIVAQEVVEALGHSWQDATTEAPKTCENCGETEGEKLPAPEAPEEPAQDHSECEANWFAELWNSIINFFRRLFGKPEKCVCGEEI